MACSCSTGLRSSLRPGDERREDCSAAGCGTGFEGSLANGGLEGRGRRVASGGRAEAFQVGEVANVSHGTR
jgi:hypothetical protein